MAERLDPTLSVEIPNEPIPQASSASQPETPSPREGEGELCAWVEALKDDAAKRRSSDANDDNWDEWDAQMDGEEMWPDNLASFKPPININEMKMVMLSELSDLTDAPMKVYVQKDPKNPARAENAEKTIQSYWKRSLIDQKVMLAAFNAIKFPCGFLTVTWNPLLRDGLGDIDVRVRDSRTVYPDPDAPDETSLRYLIFEDLMDIVEIRRLWPDQGGRVRPDESVSQKHDNSNTPRGASGGYVGPIYAPSLTRGLDGYIKARARVLTCFVEDDTEETIYDESGPELIERSVRKYPNGRLMQIANGVVLFDEPNPYPDWTLVRIVLEPCTTFWPRTSIVGGVVENYKAANKLDSAVVENAMRLNGGKQLLPANCGIDPGKISNIPGEIWVYNANAGEPKIIYPAAMPADMVNAGERLRSMTTQKALGHNPSRMGTGSKGNVAAELTETEISQSMGISRLRGRLLFTAVQRLISLIFARMAQFYTVERSMPVITAAGWQEVAWTPIEPDSAKRYQVFVDSNAFMVRSKTSMQKLALMLMKMNKLSTRAGYEMLELPNWPKLAQEHDQELAMMAAAKGHMKQGKK